MKQSFEGSCLCGGIRLTYSGTLGPANYCHCEDCRRANGSAFNIGVRVDRSGLVVKASTKLRAYRYLSASGRKIERYFCSNCGSPIFTLHPAKPKFAWVKAGIINNPDLIKPSYENWIKDKVGWAVPGGIKSYEKNKPA